MIDLDFELGVAFAKDKEQHEHEQQEQQQKSKSKAKAKPKTIKPKPIKLQRTPPIKVSYDVSNRYVDLMQALIRSLDTSTPYVVVDVYGGNGLLLHWFKQLRPDIDTLVYNDCQQLFDKINSKDKNYLAGVHVIDVSTDDPDAIVKKCTTEFNGKCLFFINSIEFDPHVMYYLQTVDYLLFDSTDGNNYIDNFNTLAKIFKQDELHPAKTFATMSEYCCLSLHSENVVA